MNSFFLRIGRSDLFKGVVVATLTAMFSIIIPVLEASAFPTSSQIKSAIVAGITAGLAYLLKNLLTNSRGEMMKKEPA